MVLNVLMAELWNNCLCHSSLVPHSQVSCEHSTKKKITKGEYIGGKTSHMSRGQISEIKVLAESVPSWSLGENYVPSSFLISSGCQQPLTFFACDSITPISGSIFTWHPTCVFSSPMRRPIITIFN